jgi:prepilin-type N-terminal cleavage/methylation domain-containing protein
MEMKHRQQQLSLRCSNKGFTMIELMIAMVVSLLALAAIYSTFLAQHRSYQVQNETADMQQNIRAAMYYMQREIRMAGNDPFNTDNFGFGSGTSTANANVIQFTEDIDDGAGGGPDGVFNGPDGVLNGDDTIQYNLADPDGDGVNDLFRNNVMVARNIDAIDFVYLDAAGAPLNSGGGGVSPPLYSQIRSVEITVVARTDDPLLYGTTNNNPYVNQRGFQILPPQADNFSRRRLTTLIHCRNLGL